MSISAAVRKPAPAAAAREALAFVTDAASREVVAEALREGGFVGASIVEGGINAALKQVELGTPRILLVDVSSTSTPVQDVAALAAVMEPGTKLIVIGAAIWIMHRANIARLLKGEEAKIKLGSHA